MYFSGGSPSGCSVPAAKKSVPVAPAFIALNAGEFIFLTGFIRLRWKW